MYEGMVRMHGGWSVNEGIASVARQVHKLPYLLSPWDMDHFKDG